MRFCLVFTALVASVLAIKRTTAPTGALVVGGDGSYSTIQDAVNALDTSTTAEQSIFINPGTYSEQVYIQALSGPLSVYGYTNHVHHYSSNQVTISHSASQADGIANDDLTATLRVWTSNAKFYNLNVENTYGEGSQALALSANAASQGYYACSFTGFQDTVLAEVGAQLYAQTYIEGATDFIFGQEGQAWFENCDLRVPSTTLGYVTASGRDSDDASYYVINNSSIEAADGADVPAGSMYLGRPWEDYARVAVQFTYLSDIINSAGWSIWNTGDAQTDHVSFGEYENTGPGSEGTRASFSTQLSEPVAIGDVLGSDYASQYWVDTSYIK